MMTQTAYSVGGTKAESTEGFNSEITCVPLLCEYLILARCRKTSECGFLPARALVLYLSPGAHC